MLSLGNIGAQSYLLLPGVKLIDFERFWLYFTQGMFYSSSLSMLA
jgi:hypothetical protein